MSTKVVVVGSYNEDFIFAVGDFPIAGETLNSHTMQRSHGGKGSNQAVAARRLGAEVTLVACVGNDVFGQSALQFWQQEGINVEYVRIDQERPTGTASIMVNSAGENMITLSAGANGALSVADVERAFDAIEQADVLLVQLEIPLQTAATALRLAKRRKMLTVLNPSPVVDGVLDLIAHADVVVPNEFELEQIYGNIEDLMLDQDSLAYLLAAEDQTIVVTLGDQGARWLRRDGTMGVPAFPVEALDTTGAGDAFMAALAIALHEGKALVEAIRFANATAALATLSSGGANSMPTRQAVEAFLEKMAGG